MGLLDRFRDIIEQKLLNPSTHLSPEEERAWAEYKGQQSSTVFEAGSLDPTAAPTQVTRKQQAGSYGWQMQQLMETEQRSDAAAARARNSLNRLVQGTARDAEGRPVSGKFSHVKRDGTVEVFTPAKHAGAAPIHEIPDPLYSRPSQRPADQPRTPHVVERMTPEQQERQRAAPDNLEADRQECQHQGTERWVLQAGNPIEGFRVDTRCAECRQLISSREMTAAEHIELDKGMHGDD